MPLRLRLHETKAVRFDLDRIRSGTGSPELCCWIYVVSDHPETVQLQTESLLGPVYTMLDPFGTGLVLYQINPVYLKRS